MGDRRPSQLLHVIQKRLPHTAHMILAPPHDMPLERLAALADHVVQRAVASASSATSSADPDMDIARLEYGLDKLVGAVEAVKSARPPKRVSRRRSWSRTSSRWGSCPEPERSSS